MPLHHILAEWDVALAATDPLGFPGYAPPREGESVRTGLASIDGVHPAYAFVDGCFEIMGGSMGAAAGEKVVRTYRRALDERLPIVVLTASGGARMQEGMVALAQLPRTASAAAAHAGAGLLSVAVLRAPTTGGVFVSYASLADLRAAEPGAVIGFAGPRVVELTTGHAPPGDSHTAEAAFTAGRVDALVSRPEQPAWVEAALGHRDLALSPRELPPSPGPAAGIPAQGAWLEVERARAVGRPSGVDRAAQLCDSWVELRGRDPVVRAALARIGDRRVVVIATDRYATSSLGALGRPGPDGFRLARRAIALAGRLGLSVVSLVDTPGADPGVESERDGIAQEIAATFEAFATLPTASVAVCVGEGGSGGALALAHCDRLLIQEHAIFSVIAPEAAAVILRRDAGDAAVLATQLKLTSEDLVRLGLADARIAESGDALCAAVDEALETAAVGERDRRIDAATARWLP